MSKLIWLLDVLLLLLVVCYFTLTPFSVMDSDFSIIAIHDMVVFGIYPQYVIDDSYYHIMHPIEIPRSFIGPLMLASLCKCILSLTSSILTINDYLWDEFELSFLVSPLLGAINVFSLIYLRNTLIRVTGERKIGVWFSILIIPQHIIFKCSRTLPSSSASPFVNYSYAKIIMGDLSGLVWLAFAATVFRYKLMMLALITTVLSPYLSKDTSIIRNLKYVVSGVVIGGLTSYIIDSYFWLMPALPELESFWFDLNSINIKKLFSGFIIKLIGVIPLYLSVHYCFLDLSNCETTRKDKYLSILSACVWCYSFMLRFQTSKYQDFDYTLLIEMAQMAKHISNRTLTKLSRIIWSVYFSLKYGLTIHQLQKAYYLSFVPSPNSVLDLKEYILKVKLRNLIEFVCQYLIAMSRYLAYCLHPIYVLTSYISKYVPARERVHALLDIILKEVEIISRRGTL